MLQFKKYSVAFYAIILFCFLMPFINLSCAGQKLVSITGYEISFGVSYEQPKFMSDEKKVSKVDAEPLAMLALFMCVLGIIFKFIKISKENIIHLIISAAGGIFLLLLKSKLDNDIIKEGQGVISISYEFGYWFSLLMFLCSAVFHGIVLRQGEEKGADTLSEE